MSDTKGIPIVCTVCHLSEFELLGHVYMCIECGSIVQCDESRLNETKNGSPAVVDRNGEPPPAKRPKWNIAPQLAIRASNAFLFTKQQQHQSVVRFKHLPSYYNYIMHEIVEQLRVLGTTKKFEIITLQLWIAFLQRKRIAFTQEIPKKRTHRTQSQTNSPASEVSHSSCSASSAGTNDCILEGQVRGEKPPTDKSKAAASGDGVGKGQVHMLHIYAILTIGLNLSGEEVQLCDLVRLIAEQKINPFDILDKFPADIIARLKTDHRFNVKPSYKVMHEEVTKVAKLLNIQQFYKPDLMKLSARYANDLNLPTDVMKCVERLMKLVPPEMNVRKSYIYPAYEARAMAYLVFVLKLFFGLDGHKEVEIEKSAVKVNQCLDDIQSDASSRLFIWADWVRYLDMRQMLIMRYKSRFGSSQNPEAFVLSVKNEPSKVIRKINNEATELLSAVHTIFNNFRYEFAKSSGEALTKPIDFPMTLTPGKSYLQSILNDQGSEADTLAFKFRDLTKTTIQPYYDPKSLLALFKEHKTRLRLQRVSTAKKDTTFLGTFRNAHHYVGNKEKQKAHFNIDEEEWLKCIKLADEDGLQFTTNLKAYSFNTLRKNKYAKRIRKLRGKSRYATPLKLPKLCVNLSDVDATTTVVDEARIKSLNSFEVFSEDDMEPINMTLSAPTRNNVTANVFGIGNDEDSAECSESEDSNQCLTLKVSDMEVWTLWGTLGHMKDCDVDTIRKQMPYSFFWLLENCANYLGIAWFDLYEQYVVLEACMLYGLNNVNNVKDCIYFKFAHPVKNINYLAKLYSEIL